jgi:hypothetical protein
MTGVGSSFIEKPLYSLPCRKVSEFTSVGRGGLYLSGLDEAVIVSMGTGTAYIHAYRDGDRTVTEYLGGTGVGGGTLLGLAKKMIGIDNIDHLEELAEKGDFSTALEETDPLAVYLQELARIPAQGDEALLAEKLAEKAGEEDPDLWNKLLNLSLHRVVDIAREYVGYGVLLMDLIQEGSMGLWAGMSSFTGGDFSAFRDFRIRQAMAQAVIHQSIAGGLDRRCARPWRITGLWMSGCWQSWAGILRWKRSPLRCICSPRKHLLWRLCWKMPGICTGPRGMLRRRKCLRKRIRQWRTLRTSNSANESRSCFPVWTRQIPGC